MLTLIHRILGNKKPIPAEARRVPENPKETPSQKTKYRFDISDVPRYPPYKPGLPAVHPEQILESQHEILSRLRKLVAVPAEDFDRSYLVAIRNYANFVHLLPASESHHHRGTGGLFRHGLEAALYGAAHADRSLFVLDEPPSKRRVLEPIWRFAAFLASLCHDIGKPVSDMEIMNVDGSLTWNPFVEPLHNWAETHDIDYYHIRFRQNRHQSHETIGMLTLDMVLSKELKEYLSGAGPVLLRWLIESISNLENTASVNPFRDLVIRSDKNSVEHDLRVNSSIQSHGPIGINPERTIIDAMRRLIRDKKWKVNCKGGRVWKIEGNLYVTWIAAKDIAKIINDDKSPGVPRDPDTMADMLIERSLAVPMETFEGRRRYWMIKPAILDGVTIKALRLSSPDLLIDPPPGNVPGEILLEPEKDSPKQETKESADTGKTETKTESDSKKSATEAKQKEQSSKPEAKPETRPEPKTNAAPVAPVNPSPSTSSIEVRQKEIGKESEAFAPEARGYLIELAEQIASGERPREQIMKGDNMIAIVWQDGLTGFGIKPKELLEIMYKNGMLQLEKDAKNAVRKSKDGKSIIVLGYKESTAFINILEMLEGIAKADSNREQSSAHALVDRFFDFSSRATGLFGCKEIKKNGETYLILPRSGVSKAFSKEANVNISQVKNAIDKAEESEDKRFEFIYNNGNEFVKVKKAG